VLEALLFFAAGNCTSGEACRYCHLPHHKRPVHLDKHSRELFRMMPLETCAKLTLPVLREKVKELDSSPATLGIIDGIAQSCGLSMPGYLVMQDADCTSLRRHYRKLLMTFKAMSLRLMLVSASHALAKHKPELEDMMTDLFEHLRTKTAAAVGSFDFDEQQ